ncbi:MAG: ImmA/IrrE family metallo-endopeptidase [Desulfobaccales bacterium]
MDYSGFKCKWIDKNQLRKLADQIRQEYWPEDILPIDTAKIVELRLRIDIEPVRGLLSDMDMDAYLRTDLNGIVVDHDCYMQDKFANRLRFSLAHELGNYFLHKDVYSDLPLVSTEEWKDFILNVPEAEYENFEWQANEFAGRFLVPYYKLKSKVEESLEIIRKSGLIEYLHQDPDAVLSRVSPFLRRTFGVSEQVIVLRVQREDLWPPETD